MSMESVGSATGYLYPWQPHTLQGGRAVPRMASLAPRAVAPEVLLVEAMLVQWRVDLLRVHGVHAQRAAESVRAGLVSSWLAVADYPDWRIAQAEEYFNRLAEAVEVAAIEDACERDRRRIERRRQQTREHTAAWRDRKRSA